MKPLLLSLLFLAGCESRSINQRMEILTDYCRNPVKLLAEAKWCAGYDLTNKEFEDYLNESKYQSGDLNE